MNLYYPCVVTSSLSFLAYVISYFISPHIKSEFIRFKLESVGLLVIILELLGAIGLLAGLVFKPILLISSAGLAILMLLGLLFRAKSKDNIWVSMPALLLMFLNFYILIATLDQK